MFLKKIICRWFFVFGLFVRYNNQGLPAGQYLSKTNTILFCKLCRDHKPLAFSYTHYSMRSQRVFSPDSGIFRYCRQGEGERRAIAFNEMQERFGIRINVSGAAATGILDVRTTTINGLII